MAWYSIKSSNILAPVKMVLPGIIVSLVGASAGYYIFNNPNKIRGRNSKAAWDNLVRYEKIYSDNSEKITCNYNGNIGEAYIKDLLHMQQMTIENLKLIRDDKDIDKLVSAIINLKIDTYTELGKLTQGFFDTLNYLDAHPVDSSDAILVNERSLTEEKLQSEYLVKRDHIFLRDSAIIGNLGRELKKAYKAFSEVDFTIVELITIEMLQQRVLGSWSLVANNFSLQITVKGDNTGEWKQEGESHPFTWNFDDTDLKIHFTDKFDEDVTFDIKFVSEKIMQFVFKNVSEKLLLACRQPQ